MHEIASYSFIANTISCPILIRETSHTRFRFGFTKFIRRHTFTDNILGSFDIILQITHWGRVTHICVNKLTIIVSDNGLSPGRRQAIIWTNAGIILIGPLGTNFNEIVIEI